MKLRKGLAAGAVALLMSATAACGPEQASGAADALVVAVPTDPAGVEPGTNLAEPVGSEIILNVFDTLVAWKSPGYTELEGRLAKSWKVSDDSRKFTLELRSGVKFQDGTAFDAEAVKYSLERTKKMNSYVKATFDLIDTITVDSPTQVSIDLSKSYPAFLSILAQPQSAIVSPTAAKKSGDTFDAHPVGTGPFEFKSAKAGTNVVLEANPDYFRGAPKVDRIIYRVIPDASTRRLELESGGVDIVHQQGQLAGNAAEDVKALKQNPDVKILESSSQIIRQLEFNNSATDGPFKDVRVREAIASAIDYDGLLDGVFGGTAERVYGALTTNSWAFDPKMKDLAPTYDPARAKKLLAEAGVNPADLDLTLYSYQGELWKSVATFVQANLADIGVGVKIQQTEFASYRSLQTAGKFDLALDGRQPWYNDPDAHITIGYLSSLADSAMTFRMPEDKKLDDLILKAQQEADTDQRKELYHQVQEELAKRVPGVYLFSPKLIVFQRADVKGLVINSAPPLNEYWGVSKS
ncbi:MULTISPECIES: ABC transporter substrate-binding protein [unclassified Streptomyces]|uniref:ABC transporter substrate-binding protein n=1 Tax=unclassified Streptomyces TaxID=2593676 RepID=UPI0036E82B8D